MADTPKPNFDRWAADPARWSSGREGPTPGSMSMESMATPGRPPPEPKKGSYTVPKMCGGGKVLKSWSK